VPKYEVLRVPSVGDTVENEMDKKGRKQYEAARDQLRGEGCKAAGKRLLAAGEPRDDYALCQRKLYGAWRMTTAFHARTVVIVYVGRHTDAENPNDDLAAIFPHLSASGRRRSDQPACCEDPDFPPMSSEVQGVLFEAFGL